MASNICVAVRKRPIGEDQKDVVQTKSPFIVVNEPKIKFDLTPYVERHQFAFDEVFDEKTSNREVYVRCAQSLVDTVFTRGNATCFAYGQTGSGKTHTMLGKGDEPGLYACAAHDLFQRSAAKNLDVYASFYEIYGRKIFDLLNNRAKLVAREDADKVINICGLSEHSVTSVEELLRIIASGSEYRAAGSTSANAESSRSHAVLQLDVRERNRPFGHISFIDLAGNERGSDTYDSDRKTRMEGAEINKSLLALKECIRALGMGKNHVPFRGSILTEVLRDSFLGNSRTTMIATITPVSTHCEHTVNTLRYTSRVKELSGDKARNVALPPELKQIPEDMQNLKRPPPKRAQAAPKNDKFSAMAAQIAGQANTETQDDVYGEDDAQPPQAPPPQQAGRPSQQPKPKAQARKVEKPGWNDEFAGVQQQAPSHPDPQIQNIVAAHLKDLDEIEAHEGASEDEEDEETSSPNQPEPPTQEQRNVKSQMRSSNRQVKAVHAHLVAAIRKTEEDISRTHRNHIDIKMRLMKEEVEALKRLDDGRGSVDEYAARIETLLARESKELQSMKDQITKLQNYLKEEEALSKTLTPGVKKGKK